MYEELFQTTDRPFRATPDARYYFPFDSMEHTRQTVLRAVRRAEGPAVVMGNVGLGKSLLSLLVAEELTDRFDVVRLHATRLCSRRALLQNILFELQLPYRELSEGELRLSLMERMEPAPLHAAEGLAIVVDEAHTLPVKLLEELRLITNFARQGQSRARLVLIGGMQLEETFALPELSSFNQRIAARCFLHPMNRQQTYDFIRHQFQCVNIDVKNIMTRDALENVHIASDGVPRLINQLMDHALILAIANGQTPISAALVQEAWSDLQQLPVSWGSSSPSTAPSVEFGTLEELDGDFDHDPEDELPVQVAGQPVVLQTGSSAQPFSTGFWPAPSDLEDFGPEPGSDRDMLNIDEAEESQETIEVNGNIFASWKTPASSIIEIEIDRSALGMMPASGAMQSPAQPAAQKIAPAINPFGEDFDEEFAIAADDVKRWQSNKLAQLASAAKPATATPEMHFAPPTPPMLTVPTSSDKLQAAMPLPTMPAPTMPAPTMPATHAAAPQAPVAPQPIDAQLASATHTAVAYGASADDAYGQQFIAAAAATGSVEALQQEIEDIISQLNFSAFSVEATSVEHISPDYIRQAAAPKAPDSQVGSEDEYRVYPLHTDDEIEQINITLLDDDRDLLVIEEDIPASIRFSTQATTSPTAGGRGTPVMSTPSYPEIFQQLRS